MEGVADQQGMLSSLRHLILSGVPRGPGLPCTEFCIRHGIYYRMVSPFSLSMIYHLGPCL